MQCFAHCASPIHQLNIFMLYDPHSDSHMLKTRHHHGLQTVAFYFEDRDPVIRCWRQWKCSRIISSSHGRKKMEGIRGALGYVLGSQFRIKDFSSPLLMFYRYISRSTRWASGIRRWHRSQEQKAEIAEHISRYIVLIGAQSTECNA